MKQLRVWNAVLALAHALQGIAILALANDTTIPITWSFIDGPPATGDVSTETLYDLPFGPAVAAFLFLAAIDHGLMAAPRVHRWYERNLEAEMNPARWWEYSLSASLMVVLIAMLTGIRDVTALIALFGVNVAMILFGLVMERVNRAGEPVDWRPFVYGSIVGVAPWLTIAVQLGHAESEADVPAFVIAIFVTLFVLFFSFAVNMALQYLHVGPWRSYLFGERVYLVLSLVAKRARSPGRSSRAPWRASRTLQPQPRWPIVRTGPLARRAGGRNVSRVRFPPPPLFGRQRHEARPSGRASLPPHGSATARARPDRVDPGSPAAAMTAPGSARRGRARRRSSG
jgi:hypothetical protein